MVIRRSMRAICMRSRSEDVDVVTSSDEGLTERPLSGIVCVGVV